MLKVKYLTQVIGAGANIGWEAQERGYRSLGGADFDGYRSLGAADVDDDACLVCSLAAEDEPALFR